MEAVGHAQSEAKVGSIPAESFETFDDFLSDDEFDAIFASADKTRSVQSTFEHGNNEELLDTHKNKSERENIREKTIERLVTHFGSQEFLYSDKYRGTVTEMIALCPAIDAVLDEGFEYVRDWLGPHMLTEQQPEELKSKNQDDDDGQDDVKESASESGAVEAAAPILAKLPENAKAEQKTPPAAEELKTLELKAESTLEAASEPEVASVMPDASFTPVAEAPSVEIESSIYAFKGIESIETASDSSLSTDTEQPQQDPITSDVIELSEKHEVLATDGAMHEKAIVEREGASVSDVEQGSKRDERVATLINTVADEPIEIHEDEPVASILDNEGLIEEPDTSGSSSDQFDVWRDIAQDEPPLDELFMAIADRLEDNIQDEEGEDIELEAELTVRYVEVSDEELNHSNQPEVFAMFTAVRSARQSLEALYTARTKEECKFYIEQIVQDLAIVLRSLGYDKPEVIIRVFLSSHSPESLRNLITELEASLRRAMIREIQQRRAGHAKSRHTRLSKFVGFIMQALSLGVGRIAESA